MKKIRCSHCKEMRPNIAIHDENWTHTICNDCLQQHHSNVSGCPRCGLTAPKKCAHVFSQAVLTTKRYKVYACHRCGQQRANSVLDTTNATIEKAVKCAHCGCTFYVPQGVSGYSGMCMGCSASGHSMYGGCLKCAAKLGKALEGNVAEANPDTGISSKVSELLEKIGKHEQLMKDVQELKAAAMIDYPSNKGLVAKLENYLKVFLGAGQKSAIDPVHFPPPNKKVAEWEGPEVIKEASVTKAPNIPKEDILCIHCKQWFKVDGDIKTWDVVFMTCAHCFQVGHRGLPPPVGNCGSCPQKPDRGLIDPEKLEELGKAKENPGRNIIL